MNIGVSLPDEPSGDVIAVPIYSALLSKARAADAISPAAFQRIAMTVADGTYELRGLGVPANYFDLLGVPIVVGRAFTADENSGAPGLPVILAYHVWQNQFQSDPQIAGRTVLLNGVAATVVGVSGPGFRGTHFAPNYEIAVPILTYARLHEEAGGLASPSGCARPIPNSAASGLWRRPIRQHRSGRGKARRRACSWRSSRP